MYYRIHGKVVLLASGAQTGNENLLFLGRYLAQMLRAWSLPMSYAGPADLLIDCGLLGAEGREIVGVSDGWRRLATEDSVIYPIRLCASQLLLGPFYRAGVEQVPCPECLASRWLRHLSQEEQQALLFTPHQIVVGANPQLLPFALETMWGVVESLLVRGDQPEASGFFHTLSLKTLELTRYQLIQDPLCPVCIDMPIDTPEAAVISLSSHKKRDVNHYHLVDVGDYKFPFEGLLNPVCGVLGTQASKDLFNAVLAPVSGIFRVNGIYTALNAEWGGQGSSYRESLPLGLLEAFERYVGHIPRGKKTVIIDSYEHLAPDALNPLECGLYTPDVYRRNHPHYAPFTPERKIRWVWGYSFLKQRSILVPEQLGYYWHYHGEPSYVQATSSGCATGSCLEEAILYGLLELIERDTFLLAWYARLALPKIDPRSDPRREIRFMLAAVEKQGYELSLLDARLDFKVPSVIAVLRSRDNHKLGQTLVAGGAHLNPEVAIKKAFSEVATYLAAFVAKVERSYEEVRLMADDYSKVTRLPHHPLLHGLPEMRKHTDFLQCTPTCKPIEETYRSWHAEYPGKQDLLEDLQYCMEMLLERGMDIIVVDQTCPEQVRLGLKTACVIVPGLVPLDFGWDRHRVLSLPRLSSIPHMMGFYDSAFLPEQANLVPHPFP